MKKTITVVKQDPEKIEELLGNGIKTDLVFEMIQRDTIGKSGSNPTWGHIYSNDSGEAKYEGIALYKGYDYDYPKAAYGEKAWSIIGKGLLNSTVRVADIDIVEKINGNEEIISYRLMDNDKEDMIHIKDTLFHKFERDEIKAKKDVYSIDEILECVKMQITDEANYKEVEKNMIQVLLLDAITNNGDRHAFNWALVRDKKTNKYELAVFDHSSAFVDMFEDKHYFVTEGWSSTYTTVGNDKGKHMLGSDGKKVVEYISKTYPEYFDEFSKRFEDKLSEVLEEINSEKMHIDFRRLTHKMQEKRRFFKKLRSRGEIEYE